MLRYQCRKCGAIKDPDGKGCRCGESWGSLKIISEKQKGLRRIEGNPKAKGKTYYCD